MLCLLLSGEYATAGELALAATVSPSTASEHLARLLESGFVVCEARGRHRYYRLADAEVAHALEAMALIAERCERDQVWSRPGRQRLRQARCCYGHLAGQLGVRVFRTLLQRECLRATAHGYDLTGGGREWLASLGMTAPSPASNRRYAYACMAWSERSDHLAGTLAAALLQHFCDQGWLLRRADRVFDVTPRGHRDLLPRLIESPE
jgi:hypothetical protein